MNISIASMHAFVRVCVRRKGEQMVGVSVSVPTVLSLVGVCWLNIVQRSSRSATVSLS